MSYNIAIKRIYRKPQNSTVRRDWSATEKLDTGVMNRLLRESRLPSRGKL